MYRVCAVLATEKLFACISLCVRLKGGRNGRGSDKEEQAKEEEEEDTRRAGLLGAAAGSGGQIQQEWRQDQIGRQGAERGALFLRPVSLEMGLHSMGHRGGARTSASQSGGSPFI